MSPISRGFAGAAALAATAVATALAAPAASAATVKRVPGALPTAILGNPGVKAHGAERFSVWHDSRGYELRVTHPGSAAVLFTGTITADAPIDLRAGTLPKGDTAVVSADRRSVTFALSDTGSVAGLTVAAGDASRVRVTLDIAGAAAKPAQVHLGRKGTAPVAVPFVGVRGAKAAVIA